MDFFFGFFAIASIETLSTNKNSLVLHATCRIVERSPDWTEVCFNSMCSHRDTACSRKYPAHNLIQTANGKRKKKEKEIISLRRKSRSFAIFLRNYDNYFLINERITSRYDGTVAIS